MQQPPVRPSSHVLRPLRVDDLDALLAIQHEGSVAVLGEVFPQDRFPFPAADIRRRWESELADPEVDCFAIVGGGAEGSDGTLLDGFAAVAGDELLHLGTARRTWGSGVAGRAHDELLAHLVSRGVERAHLRVFEANGRARSFYERRGWAQAGVPSRSEFEPHPVLLRYERDL